MYVVIPMYDKVVKLFSYNQNFVPWKFLEATMPIYSKKQQQKKKKKKKTHTHESTPLKSRSPEPRKLRLNLGI